MVIKRLQEIIDLRKTYALGLLQAKVYRLLKNHTRSSLKPYDIGTLEWACIGLIQSKKGMQPKELARELGVKLPYITQMMKKFSERNFIVYEAHPSDKRSKVIHITKQGREFVKQVEKKVKHDAQKIAHGISRSEIITYIKVLKKLERNALAVHKETPLSDIPKEWSDI